MSDGVNLAISQLQINDYDSQYIAKNDNIPPQVLPFRKSKSTDLRSCPL